MLIDKLPDDSPEAAAHRDVVHGGRRLGNLQVFAVFDGGWPVAPQELTCRMCAWPRGATEAADPGLLFAMESWNRAKAQGRLEPKVRPGEPVAERAGSLRSAWLHLARRTSEAPTDAQALEILRAATGLSFTDPEADWAELERRARLADGDSTNE